MKPSVPEYLQPGLNHSNSTPKDKKEKIKGNESLLNNLSKHFIFLNNNTICHRNITEGFKTGLAQVFFYVSSFLNNKCSINQTSQEEREHYYILQMILIMRTRHTHKNPPKTSTSSKVTPLKVSAKVSRITTTANAHHKTTNASQDYEFHTVEKKTKNKTL